MANKAPSTPAEALGNINTAISEAMTVPGMGAHLPLLQQMQQMVVGTIQKPAGPPQPRPGGQPGGAPGGPPGAGGPTGMGPQGMPPASMLGGPSQGPSAAVSGGSAPGGSTSADDIRRMIAAQAGQGS